MIAMLDGLAPHVTAGGGQNYTGGAAYPERAGFPTYASSEGLASYLREFRTTTREYGVAPGGGALYVGGATYPGQGMPVGSSATALDEYIRALGGSNYSIEPGGGQSFVGGAAYPGAGFPVYASSEGLAGSAVSARAYVLRRLIHSAERVARGVVEHCPVAASHYNTASRLDRLHAHAGLSPAAELARQRRRGAVWLSALSALRVCRSTVVARAPGLWPVVERAHSMLRGAI
ncbi:hypothetical protein [Sandaracinus amylolyticus]|uniref:hypothetical protein n=1 Tax=Sandaracinus amylolyticus TaxID=927083 RepID=UPI00069D4873|nr:hypothetical protein [Sandaracinus amylolyticus]